MNLFLSLKSFQYKHPTLAAAYFFGVLSLLFLLPSIVLGHYFINVDIFSSLYLDTTGQILPWHKLARELILHGRLPLWNDFSGMGLPLLANMQSAVFFPLSWPFYLLPFKLAVFLHVFLKLFFAGFFTYLFLDSFKLRWVSKILAGCLFAFSGAFMIWPQWSLSNVVMLLPLFLWTVTKMFETRQIKYFIYFSLLTALGFFAGHPHTFFYIYVFVLVYLVFYFIWTYKSRRDFLLLGMSGFAGLLGGVMATVILWPFLEYLNLSANIAYRSSFDINPFFLTKNLFISNLIPDFFGNPGYRNFSYLLVPNYSEITMGYVGLVGLLLALFVIFKKTKNPLEWFFSLTPVCLFVLIYNVNPIYNWVNKLPGFSWNYNNRLLYLWAFSLAILAAYGLEMILDRRLKVNKILLYSGGVLLVGLGLFYLNHKPTLFTQTAFTWSIISRWQLVFLVIFVGQLIFSTLLVIWARKSPRFAIILLVFVFLETGLHGLIFNRTTPVNKFYPVTPVLSYLQKNYPVDFYRTFVYGHVFLPNFGTWYGFNELPDYDVIYLVSNKKLKKQIAEFNYSPEYTFDQPNFSALKFFSTKYLLYPPAEGQKLLDLKLPNLKLIKTDEHYWLFGLDWVLPRVFLYSNNKVDNLNLAILDLMKTPQLSKIQTVDKFSYNSSGEINIEYSSASEKYLITTDNYMPGWQVSLGKSVLPVEDVGGMRAVKVPAGKHRLTMIYRPKSVVMGSRISLLTEIVVISLLVLVNKKQLALPKT